MPSCLFSPASTMTPGTPKLPCIKSWAVLVSSLSSACTWLTPGRKKRSNRWTPAPCSSSLASAILVGFLQKTRSRLPGLLYQHSPLAALSTVALSEPECSKRPAISIAPARMMPPAAVMAASCDKQHPGSL